MGKRCIGGTLKGFVIALALSVSTFASAQATIKVAVAANFKDTLNTLITAYQGSGATYADSLFTVISGATGDFQTAISSGLSSGTGTPYDLFLSANQAAPVDLRTAYPAYVGVPFFYAEGKLVLWSKYGPNVSLAGYAGFPSPSTYSYANGQVAIANPSTAPYGAAAQQVLSRVAGITYPGGTQSAIFTQYSTIGLTYSGVDASSSSSTYPDMGFIAKSQICDGSSGNIKSTLTGTYYVYTPSSTTGGAPHDRILQYGTAISGRSGADANAVADFVAYLRTTPALAIIANYCYGTSL